MNKNFDAFIELSEQESYSNSNLNRNTNSNAYSNTNSNLNSNSNSNSNSNILSNTNTVELKAQELAQMENSLQEMFLSQLRRISKVNNE